MLIFLRSIHPASFQLLFATLLIGGFLAGGCTAASHTTTSGTSGTEVAHRLRAEAHRWNGTPHRLGGVSRQGADCSGLVQTVYADLFRLSLPRTTSEQVNTGTLVRENAWQPGDLVFFEISRSTRHVGIYLGNGEFFHVSSSRGAMISHLEEPYWRDRYWTARRVLHTAPVATLPPDAPVPLTPLPELRTGW